MWMDVVTALWANAVGVCGGLDGSCCNPLQMQRCIQHDRGHHWDLPRWDKHWNEDLDLKRGLRTPPFKDGSKKTRLPASLDPRGGGNVSAHKSVALGGAAKTAARTETAVPLPVT